ncbi:MAG: hypothetical protein U0670_03500 [Anaerolineae bacterium]
MHNEWNRPQQDQHKQDIAILSRRKRRYSARDPADSKGNRVSSHNRMTFAAFMTNFVILVLEHEHSPT